MASVVINIDKRSISDLMFVRRLGRFLSVAPRIDHSVFIVHDGHDLAETIIENSGLEMTGLASSDWQGISGQVYAGLAT